MKKKIGDLTINELLNYFKNTCKEIECEYCPFACSVCGSLEQNLNDLIEDVGENTLIEVDDE